MIYPCLLSVFLAYSDLVNINIHKDDFWLAYYWPDVLQSLAIVFFVLFLCGLVAYAVTLVMDLVKYIKSKKNNK